MKQKWVEENEEEVNEDVILREICRFMEEEEEEEEAIEDEEKEVLMVDEEEEERGDDDVYAPIENGNILLLFY